MKKNPQTDLPVEDELQIDSEPIYVIAGYGGGILFSIFVWYLIFKGC